MRRTTGPGLLESLGGVLDEETLSEECYAFAEEYFGYGEDQYFADLEELLCKDLPSKWHIQDTWQNLDRVMTKIDERYSAWRRA